MALACQLLKNIWLTLSVLSPTWALAGVAGAHGVSSPSEQEQIDALKTELKAVQTQVQRLAEQNELLLQKLATAPDYHWFHLNGDFNRVDLCLGLNF